MLKNTSHRADIARDVRLAELTDTDPIIELTENSTIAISRTQLWLV